jgi:iron complex outermembrane receptor protein
LAPSKPGTTPRQVPQTSAFPACAQFLIKNEPNNYQYNYVDGIDLSANYHFGLESLVGQDIGKFTIGSNLTQIMKFDDAFSLGTPAPSQIFSTINTDGYNVGFPTVAFTSRTHLGWIWQNLIGDVWMNYTGGYKNISATSLNTYGSFPNGNVNINVGGDHVPANVTFDAHIGYVFDGGVFGDDMVSLNINNIADKEPPFFNSSLGYDASEGNPLGRTISLSLTLKK